MCYSVANQVQSLCSGSRNIVVKRTEMSAVLGLTFYWGRDTFIAGLTVMKLLQWLLRSLCSCSPFCILWNRNGPLNPVLRDATSLQFFPLPHGLGSAWPHMVCRSTLCTPWSTLTWGGPGMPHFLSCLHRPSENELENSELSLLWVWGFVLFLRILMPFSSFLFTELVSFHFTRVWGNSWPKSDRCEGSLICQMGCSKPLCHPLNPFCVLFY